VLVSGVKKKEKHDKPLIPQKYLGQGSEGKNRLRTSEIYKSAQGCANTRARKKTHVEKH